MFYIGAWYDYKKAIVVITTTTALFSRVWEGDSEFRIPTSEFLFYFLTTPIFRFTLSWAPSSATTLRIRI